MTDRLGHTILLQPTDTVRAFKARGTLQPTVNWTEMQREQHAIAFTVSKVAKLDILRQFYSTLFSVTHDGGTYDEWKAKLVPELKRQGWWGLVTDKALTGSDKPVLVNERRLRTIYDTNVRMSLASGHWLRIQRQKAELPYLRYLPSSSEHRRPLHKLWYGVLLPVDDPWWQSHFPPNGWGCKCHVEQVSERRRLRNGWEVTKQADIATAPPRQFSPPGRPSVMVPAGIDPGFEYNPGTAHLRAIAEKAATSLGQATDAGLLDAARTTVRELVSDVAFDQFLGIPDAPFPVGILGSGEQKAIGAAHPVVVLARSNVLAIAGRSEPLAVDDFRQLPSIIAQGVSQASGLRRRAYFWSDGGGKFWQAEVETAKDLAVSYVTGLSQIAQAAYEAAIMLFK